MLTGKENLCFEVCGECFCLKCFKVDDEVLLVVPNNSYFKVKVSNYSIYHIYNNAFHSNDVFSAKDYKEVPNNSLFVFTMNNKIIKLLKTSKSIYMLSHIYTEKFTILTDEMAAPCNGKIVHTNAGHIRKGSLLFIIESMKTRVHIHAKSNGFYTELKGDGCFVNEGDGVLSIKGNFVFNDNIMFDEDNCSNDINIEKKFS